MASNVRRPAAQVGGDSRGNADEDDEACVRATRHNAGEEDIPSKSYRGSHIQRTGGDIHHGSHGSTRIKPRHALTGSVLIRVIRGRLFRAETSKIVAACDETNRQ
jgi:hypothetical protein